MMNKLRMALATASVVAATGATALLGAGAAHASGNDNASVSGRDVSVGWGDGTTNTCPSGDICMYTNTNYTGKMFAFGHCEVYSLANWNGYGSWVNNQTLGNAYNTDARVLNRSHGEIDRLSAHYPWWGPNYYWVPAWYVQPCGYY
jgi:hypothetical protein